MRVHWQTNSQNNWCHLSKDNEVLFSQTSQLFDKIIRCKIDSFWFLKKFISYPSKDFHLIHWYLIKDSWNFPDNSFNSIIGSDYTLKSFLKKDAKNFISFTNQNDKRNNSFIFSHQNKSKRIEIMFLSTVIMTTFMMS